MSATTRCKVTPEIAQAILRMHGLPPAEICQQIARTYGVTLTPATVYRTWQSAHVYQGTPAAHPPGAPFASKIFSK